MDYGDEALLRANRMMWERMAWNIFAEFELLSHFLLPVVFRKAF
jgi:hypothetical protein